MVVVYPDAVWYCGRAARGTSRRSCASIWWAGRPVERLRYRNRPGKNKLPRDADDRPIGRPERIGKKREQAEAL